MIAELLADWATYSGQLLGGLGTSLKLTALTLLIGFPAGLLLAIGSGARAKAARTASLVFVEIGRGTPALVLLQIVYNGLPRVQLTWPAFACAVLALSLTTAAYSSEIFRGGLQAVPDGEVEAGAALGMSRRDILRDLVIPQGLRIALPPLMGFAIIVFQMTSLAYSISLTELFATGRSIGLNSFKAMNMFILVGLLYAAITIPSSWLTERVEKRMGRHL